MGKWVALYDVYDSKTGMTAENYYGPFSSADEAETAFYKEFGRPPNIHLQGVAELKLDGVLTMREFLQSASLCGDLSIYSNTSLNLDDKEGVPGVVWDDCYWAVFNPETGKWCFEAWDAQLLVSGDYMRVAEAAYKYALNANGLNKR